MHKLALAILVCLFAGMPMMALAATVAPALIYQGKLTDAGGTPISGTYSVTFRIYDVAAGGTALSTDTHSVTATEGLFTTTILVSNPAVVDGRALWLGVTVGTDGEMTPRQPIQPVAYALSLRPGAVIQGDASANPSLKVINTGSDSASLIAGTTGTNSPALVAMAQGLRSPAVYGWSWNDVGVYGNGVEGGYFTTSREVGVGVNVSTAFDSNDGVRIATIGKRSDGVDISTRGDASDGIHAAVSGTGSRGVYGQSERAEGIRGESIQSVGVLGYSVNQAGIWGVSQADIGVYGEAPGVAGVLGYSNNGRGIWGVGKNGGSFSTTQAGTLEQAWAGVNVTTSYDNNPGVWIETAGIGSPGVKIQTEVSSSPGVTIETNGWHSPGVRIETEGYNSPGVTIRTYGFSDYIPLPFYHYSSSGAALRAVAEGTDTDGIEAFSYHKSGIIANTDRSDHKYGVSTEDYMLAGRYDTVHGDVAEYMPVTGSIEPGTVLVIAKGGTLQPSTIPYDTRVAGIVSTAPGVSLGTKADGNPGEALIAVAGRVPCRVDASNGPIVEGDLLTTSSRPGHAMKATDPKIGTILGKAMGSLESGTGLIEVIVTLQ
jgi:hypothetical protein